MDFIVRLRRNANLDGAMSGYYPDGDAPDSGWEITDLAAVANDPDEIDLTWTPNDIVDVQWFPPPSLGGDDWQTIATNLAGGSYTHTGVANSVDDNSYRLKHVGEPVYSNEAYANTTAIPAAGVNIIHEDTLASGFTGWSLIGSEWSAETGFARVSYNGAGTGKYQLIKLFGSVEREVYVSFDVRQGGDLGLGSKTMKLFGEIISGNNSNATFGQGYNNGNYDGAFYGNNASGENDTQELTRFNGTTTDTRSVDLNFIVNQLSHIGSSTSWRRWQWHWTQNSAPEVADGKVELYIDGDIKLDVRNMFNRGDNSTGLEKITFGDFTAATGVFNLDFRNIIVSTGGWKAGDEP